MAQEERASDRRAPNNRTIRLDRAEEQRLVARCRTAEELEQRCADPQRPSPPAAKELHDAVFHADFFTLQPLLPAAFVDLLVFDPPYNLDKRYGQRRFSRRGEEEYAAYLAAWLDALYPLLKPGASLYLCCDWRSSATVQNLLAERFIIRNRIVWEREKGRAARRNWKNNAEDIWFATVSERYYFDAEAVKVKRRVRAPYRRADGSPKDWQEEREGRYRLTAAANIWNDITVPYWSMPENTNHPAQKPEKLLAKIILASSRRGDLVFDPCAGSGSTPVTARKLGRRYAAVEREEGYCALINRRLDLAGSDPSIQGYSEGVFWERNSGPGS